ncbi:MBL fold metallo-hydrolase [Streptomyces thinghirensis]|nr:MBL fold metallo-hydrolase [Streptomyces thinghirensis]
MTWEDLGWERLAAGVGRRRLPVWDCTAGLVVGAGAALVVDAGSSLGEGARLRAGAQELAGHRVTHLALTHPHFDHVFGAAAFAGAEVYGAVGTDAVFARGGHGRGGAALGRGGRRTGRAAGGGGGRRARPRPPRGLRRVDARPGRRPAGAARQRGPGAHRSRDLAVLVPGEVEVVFCGDLVEESGEPQAGPDAVPSHWPAALDRLLDLGGEGRAVRPRSRCGGGRGVRQGPTGRAGRPLRRVALITARPLLVSSSECASTPPT